MSRQEDGQGARACSANLPAQGPGPCDRPAKAPSLIVLSQKGHGHIAYDGSRLRERQTSFEEVKLHHGSLARVADTLQLNSLPCVPSLLPSALPMGRR